MKPLSLVLSFLPLVSFSLLARSLPASDIGVAALVALVFALIAIAHARPAWPPKILNATSAVLFAVITVAGFASGHGTDRWLSTWAGAGVGLVLGAVVLLLVPVIPFTEQYARESTPQAYWNSPTFKRINRVLSAGWGAAFVLLGLSRTLAAFLAEHVSGRMPQTVFGIIVPILVVVAMFRFSKNYPDRVSHQQA